MQFSATDGLHPSTYAQFSVTERISSGVDSISTQSLASAEDAGDPCSAMITDI